MRVLLRLVFWSLVALFTAILLFFAWLTIPLLSDPVPGFSARKGTIQSARLEGTAVFDAVEYSHVTLTSSSGLEVQFSLRKPQQHTGRMPLVILLGGHRTGRDAVRLIKTERPVIVAALSYPHNADPRAKGAAVLPNLREYSRAFRDVTPAVMLALDYLSAQSDVDAQRIELVGISLGAFLVSVPAALDQRVRRVWLIHGAGDPQQVIAHNLKHRIAHTGLRNMAATYLMMYCYGDYLRPEQWLSRIAPRRIVVVNARKDERLPIESVKSLHRALPDTAEVIWTAGQHVEPKRVAIINQLVDIVFQRIIAD
ncbi:MAG: hypothetical protein OEZ39_07345 [Gammaproteobacteria bacterium]|nr:hypothetical protein [Gammaproteobacteria bacterium]MDH5651673.1 hypothetical protein [Gammaproteobacteria bacterium]